MVYTFISRSAKRTVHTHSTLTISGQLSTFQKHRATQCTTTCRGLVWSGGNGFPVGGTGTGDPHLAQRERGGDEGLVHHGRLVLFSTHGGSEKKKRKVRDAAGPGRWKTSRCTATRPREADALGLVPDRCTRR
eukprot:3367707-Pyramimonas_sp.AAC.2